MRGSTGPHPRVPSTGPIQGFAENTGFWPKPLKLAKKPPWGGCHTPHWVGAHTPHWVGAHTPPIGWVPIPHWVGAIPPLGGAIPPLGGCPYPIGWCPYPIGWCPYPIGWVPIPPFGGCLYTHWEGAWYTSMGRVPGTPPLGSRNGTPWGLEMVHHPWGSRNGPPGLIGFVVFGPGPNSGF